MSALVFGLLPRQWRHAFRSPRRRFGRISGRQLVALLTLSGAGLVSIVTHESYTEKPSSPRRAIGPPWGSEARSTKTALP